MIAHIQQQAQKTVELFKARDFGNLARSHIQVLVEELNRLNPLDFLTAFRWNFIDTRRRARRLAELQDADWSLLVAVLEGPIAARQDGPKLHCVADALEIPQSDRFQLSNPDFAWAPAQNFVESATTFFGNLAKLLGQGYGGEGSHIETRSFNWIKNKSLRKIVERDYKELMLKVYPSYAWKMTVVAAGSILEAILYDLLTRNAARVKAVESEPSAPKKQDPMGPKGAKVPRDIKNNKGEDKWDLIDFIRIATNLKLLPTDRGDAIDQTLRDWRNFVHPHKEIKADYEITDAEAETAVGNLKCVCNHLEKNCK